MGKFNLSLSSKETKGPWKGKSYYVFYGFLKWISLWGKTKYLVHFS